MNNNIYGKEVFIMTSERSLDLLEKQITKLQQDLGKKLGEDINNLNAPEVLEINSEIDKLLVCYIKLIT